MRIKSFLKSNNGSIMVLALAFFMITIFVFGLIIDTQRLQLARQKAYIAADMASLAGARMIDEDLAMGVNLPDHPSNGPIAKIKEDMAKVEVERIISLNQFDKGGQTWFKAGNNIFVEKVEVINGDINIDRERRMATIKVTTGYLVKPFILSILNYDTEVFAETKSVVYLVL